jgi:hypothetical protein
MSAGFSTPDGWHGAADPRGREETGNARILLLPGNGAADPRAWRSRKLTDPASASWQNTGSRVTLKKQAGDLLHRPVIFRFYSVVIIF